MQESVWAFLPPNRIHPAPPTIVACLSLSASASAHDHTTGSPGKVKGAVSARFFSGAISISVFIARKCMKACDQTIIDSATEGVIPTPHARAVRSIALAAG